MTIRPRFLPRALFIVGAALVITGLSANQFASAANVQTTMRGHVENVTPPLQGQGVQVGDPFIFVATYDDASGLASQTTVGGTVYFLTTYTFATDMRSWSGTLATFLATRNPSQTSSVIKQDWSRPIGTLHHEEWSMSSFGLSLITHYNASSGESYGWYQYGQAANIAFLFDSVVTTPVPEPSTQALSLAGLFATVLLVMFRRPKAQTQLPKPKNTVQQR